MSVKLLVSSDLDTLAKAMVDTVRQQGLSVFQPLYVVTQTDGMNNWLQNKMAENTGLGIAANTVYHKPNQFLYEVYRLLGGTYMDVYSHDNLCWLLFKILGEAEFHRFYPTIAAYYTEGGEADHVKRLALAEEVADLFDQYQIYRPDLIARWNHAVQDTGYTPEWQQYLWRRAKILAGDKLLDKTTMSAAILKNVALHQHVEVLREAVPVVHIFGISILTPYHIDLIEMLSRHIDLVFYLQNPAPDCFWYDTVNEKMRQKWEAKGKVVDTSFAVGNDLLTGLGKVVRETFCNLFEKDGFINAYETLESGKARTDTLLHNIQYHITENLNASEIEPLDMDKLADGSVTIHSCHTPAREVEVLYNYLVHLIDVHEERLSARDIVVMVSDIDQYAPYIDAVFENAPHKIRYRIADNSYTDGDNLMSALKALLEFGQDDFKSETLLQLLDFSCIRERFKIADIALIRTAVQAANIRFGTKGNVENETNLVSWSYGLQRIIYGSCMLAADEYDDGQASYLPFDVAEGSEALELVKFSHFVDVLESMVADRSRRSRTIARWTDHVRWTVDNLIAASEDEDEEESHFLQLQMDAYAGINELVGDEIGYDVFIRNFLHVVKGSVRNASFLSGGVTFCSLIPMRSIPFRVVALLGMNFDKFPRKDVPVSFDLMLLEKRRGDRNIKDNDNHLFLETILSAKDYLYISYVGQSSRDNSNIPPSAIVDRFIDYAGTITGCDDVRGRMIVCQPMHSFSSKYTPNHSVLYNYLNSNRQEVQSLFAAPKGFEPFDFTELGIPALVAFCKNPVAIFYKDVYNIRYGEMSELLPEEEKFELDSLDVWSLKNELMRTDADLDELRLHLVKQGRLPLKNVGMSELNRLRPEVAGVRAKYRERVAGIEEREKAIELEIGGTVLKGSLEHLFDDVLVDVGFSQKVTQHSVAAYVKFLIGAAAGIVTDLFFIDGVKGSCHTLPPIPQVDAMQRLTEIVDLYRFGHEVRVPFYPKFINKAEEVAKLTKAAWLKKIREKVNDTDRPTNDRYMVDIFNEGCLDTDAAFDNYQNAVKLLVAPWLKSLPIR